MVFEEGSKNPRWNNGKHVTSLGYVLILCKDHPHANCDGYVYEHRLILEKKLGKYLKPKERVHHVNGIKDDNRPKNLKLLANIGENTSIHNKEKIIIKRDNNGRFVRGGFNFRH